MQMMFCFVIVTLVALCHQSLGVEVEELNPATVAQIAQILHNASSKSLEYVGAYDGKIYFTDPQHMSWSSANEYCKNDTMELVTLRNQNERNYLAARKPFQGLWWTSATATNEYYWPNGVMVDLDAPIAHPTCVVIDSPGATAEPCSGNEHRPTYSYYPLCEALSG